MYSYKFIFILIPILLLAGCGNKRPAKLQFIDQARLIDIPILPNTKSIINLNTKNLNNNSNNSLSSNSISLKYKTSLTFNQIEKFYLESMEQSDWQLGWQSIAQQACMIFQKPKRVCVIIIEDLSLTESSDSGCQVRIVSGPR